MLHLIFCSIMLLQLQNCGIQREGSSKETELPRSANPNTEVAQKAKIAKSIFVDKSKLDSVFAQLRDSKNITTAIEKLVQDGENPGLILHVLFRSPYATLDGVKQLLEDDKLDINLAINGETPLTTIINYQFKQLDIIQLLINHKNIDVNLANKTGSSPLFLVLVNILNEAMKPSVDATYDYYNDLNIFKLLLGNKATDVNLANSDFRTPLYETLLYFQLYFKDHNLDPNDIFISMFIDSKLKTVLELLLAHKDTKIDLPVKTGGLTPLNIAKNLDKGTLSSIINRKIDESLFEVKIRSNETRLTEQEKKLKNNKPVLTEQEQERKNLSNAIIANDVKEIIRLVDIPDNAYEISKYALKTENEELIRALMAKFNPSSKAFFFLDAASEGKKKIVFQLIKEGYFDINYKNDHGNRTALSQAIVGQQDELVADLISSGADIFDEDNLDAVIEYALENDNKFITDKLMAKTDSEEVKSTLLKHAVKTDNFEILNQLTTIGINVNYPDANGNTAIFFANGTNMINKLIELGADINHLNKYGFNVLCAKRMRNVHTLTLEIFNVFIDKNITITNDNGKNSLSRLFKTITYLPPIDDVEPILKKLISMGFDINDSNLEINDVKMTPLIYAILTSTEVDIIKFLLKNGANVNKSDEDGWTPLMYAIFTIDDKNIKSNEVPIELINNGADVTKASTDGSTAISLAEKYKNEEMIKIIKDKLANAQSATESTLDFELD